MHVHPLKKQVSPCVTLRFPHFEKHYQGSKRPSNAYYFDTIDCRAWYQEFVERVIDASDNKRYLPVYRMADGEYNFALGGNYYDRLPVWQIPPQQLVSRLRNRILRKPVVHRSGSREYGWEEYTLTERMSLMEKYVSDVRKIAQTGILALALHDSKLFKPYAADILDWFDSNQVRINADNYYHFYSVYVMMHGPDRHRVLKNRHVLVVTSLDEKKEVGIKRGLQNIGVASVQFLPISKTKAMLDILDLSVAQMPVDIVLVGAGVGSVNVLVQLEPLKTACLDVGFALSTLVNPDLRWNRPYCIPDDDYDPTRIRWSTFRRPVCQGRSSDYLTLTRAL
ncbi:MAG: hypothetical protein JW966_05460 [Anaerolineae bacterium]|nr:hypothetical protein [Anaerolineae bacterium]